MNSKPYCLKVHPLASQADASPRAARRGFCGFREGARFSPFPRPLPALAGLALFCLILSGSLAAQTQPDGPPVPAVLGPAENPGAFPAASAEAATGAWIIPVQGDIKPSLVAFVRREAHKALARGAAFIIFEIDTFGGRVDSALQITSFITSLENVKTVAWVRNSENSMGVSWSAGALIAFSCQEIYMAAGTSMGAAAPVVMGADGSTQGTGEKTVAAVRS
jgi:membrane-bound ClpP family serine protease